MDGEKTIAEQSNDTTNDTERDRARPVLKAKRKHEYYRANEGFPFRMQLAPEEEEEKFHIPPCVMKRNIVKPEPFDLKKAAENDQYLVECVVDSKMENGKKLYRVKWVGYDLNCGDEEQWLGIEQFCGELNAVNFYEEKEKKMKSIAKYLMEHTLHMNKEQFEDTYKDFKHRKDYEKVGRPVTDGEYYRLQLRQVESRFNEPLQDTNQAPLYIENWTQDYVFPDTFEFIPELRMTCDVYSGIRRYATNLFTKNSEKVSMGLCSCDDSKCSFRCSCAASGPGHVRVNPDGSIRSTDLKKGFSLVVCGPNCGCGPECPRKSHEAGRTTPLLLFYHGKHKGWGLIALSYIPVGKCMGKYTGQVKLFNPYEIERPSIYEFAVVGYTDDTEEDEPPAFIVDAEKIGNETRFFNHACDPNMVPINVYLSENICFNEIAFYTRRPVKTGEELTFAYCDPDTNIDGVKCLCRPGCETYL